jgi:hypothetical protein
LVGFAPDDADAVGDRNIMARKQAEPDGSKAMLGAQ